MMEYRQRRGWVLIAAIAIGIALLCLLALHSQSGSDGQWLAIVPLLLIGVISPLSLLPRMTFCYAGRTPAAPAMAPAFQRPPPFPLD